MDAGEDGWFVLSAIGLVSLFLLNDIIVMMPLLGRPLRLWLCSFWNWRSSVREEQPSRGQATGSCELDNPGNIVTDQHINQARPHMGLQQIEVVDAVRAP
jgi:hypothetical protein